MADWLERWWPMIAFVLGGIIAALAHLYHHGRKHQCVDDRLADGERRFDELREDIKKATGEIRSAAMLIANIEGRLNGAKDKD